MAARAVTCVAYHHFEAVPGEATRHLGISTPPSLFARHLDYFEAHFDVIGLDRLLAGDIPDRALLITIDDAYRSVAEIAAPELAARGLPAVLFTNPRVVSGPMIPLDNLLSMAVCRMGLAAVSRLIASISGASESQPRNFGELVTGTLGRLGLPVREHIRLEILARLAGNEAQLHRLLDLFMSESQLAALAASGIEVANHTRSHTHCGALTEAYLDSEIRGAKAEIEAITGRPVRAFSFPYGNERDATPAALEILRSSGHLAQFLVHARSNKVRPAPDLWYRVSLTDEAVGRLPLALGLLPALRTLKTASKSLISSIR
jgi:peptidoglycan/xylan/chitin deacetylase (PgdA/CDA1 family)